MSHLSEVHVGECLTCPRFMPGNVSPVQGSCRRMAHLSEVHAGECLTRPRFMPESILPVRGSCRGLSHLSEVHAGRLSELQLLLSARVWVVSVTHQPSLQRPNHRLDGRPLLTHLSAVVSETHCETYVRLAVPHYSEERKTEWIGELLFTYIYCCCYLYFVTTPFSDQLWTICMEFGKSATNFDRPHAESCPNGRRNVEPPKLPALFPNCMHCGLNWPRKRCIIIFCSDIDE